MPILILSLLTLIINLFLGMWRHRFKKFSFKWWLIIHASIPLIVPLRIYFQIHTGYIPLFIGLAILGQFLGYRYRCF